MIISQPWRFMLWPLGAVTGNYTSCSHSNKMLLTQCNIGFNDLIILWRVICSSHGSFVSRWELLLLLPQIYFLLYFFYIDKWELSFATQLITLYLVSMTHNDCIIVKLYLFILVQKNYSGSRLCSTVSRCNIPAGCVGTSDCNAILIQHYNIWWQMEESKCGVCQQNVNVLMLIANKISSGLFYTQAISGRGI